MPKAADLCKVGLKYLGVPYSRMDCQAFVEKCLQDIGISENLPGSNAWYRRMTWTGSPEECKDSFGRIPPGAFLFILKQDGNEPGKYRADGIGNASHIGIYTGMSGREMCEASGVQDAGKYNFGDNAINSSSTHACVCTSKFAGRSISGGWNRVGLWDALSYDGISLKGEDRMQATAWALNGATVNMRMKASRSAPLVDQVPIGAKVEVISQDTDWSHVTYNSKKGYIMSQYLVTGDFDPGVKDQEEFITVKRSELQKVYDLLGALLGARG